MKIDLCDSWNIYLKNDIGLNAKIYLISKEVIETSKINKEFISKFIDLLKDNNIDYIVNEHPKLDRKKTFTPSLLCYINMKDAKRLDNLIDANLLASGYKFRYFISSFKGNSCPDEEYKEEVIKHKFNGKLNVDILMTLKKN